jgi:homeobox-leucine zipper protein
VLTITPFLLYRGFNDAISSFNDDGWSVLGGDGVDDVFMAFNTKMNRNNHSSASAFGAPGGIICVKASMLLQVRLH